MPMSAPPLTPADVFLSDVAELETKLADLKHRYQQVQTDDTAWTELQARQQVVQSRGQSLASQQELQEIAGLEQVLENQLLTILEQVLENHQALAGWSNLFHDLFWNTVRFGGLGLLIGWSLKTWLG
jgi:hypothetical protein